MIRKLKSILLSIIKRISPLFYVNHIYRKIFQKKLDINNPKGFNEKILWLILYWQHPLIVKCADKYGIREYVSEVLGETGRSIFPELYGVYEMASEIDWEKLPDKFAVKCTHGCKMNIVVNDKSKLDYNDAIKKLEQWMKIDYGSAVYEPHYSYIKHQIIAEEYIETESGFLPDDYKVYCFNGEPKCVLVCLERQSGELRLEWYDLDWNVLNIGVMSNERKAHRPSCLENMIRYAKILSKPFPFVRVDFYDRQGDAILGEMTFTPMYGMAKYYSEQGNRLLGSWLELPGKYNGHFT